MLRTARIAKAARCASAEAACSPVVLKCCPLVHVPSARSSSWPEVISVSNIERHAALMAGSENGAVIVPGDAANSLLVELVATQEMPKRGPKLTPPQVQIITDWVNQGALDN